ncbi:hypothetical protein Si039_00833 [Streptococcus infantarius subsp. infantarius]|nr:hypothetical protein [Streptococcus infantarius subsp. infantarius]MCO4625077.1 hypothetical protein [Streptococcus infantarius subsp. infantarius]MCO4629528.1 hypothetical protein [Streptococcus infantarius subsp. infantarius]MCO4632482.1 hypothetical protein [Streptococcus infantarius subsp. infantarius]MCO4633902.1 hypothetical protein [Streptococcus infantarius subsp. infantarius]
MKRKKLEKISELIFQQLSEEEKDMFMAMDSKQRVKWLKQFFYKIGGK